MTNVLSCWFWKKKNKSKKMQPNLRTERNNELCQSYMTAGSDLENYSNHRKMSIQSRKLLYRRGSETLSKDPKYLERVFGLNPDRKIRSYPPSPVRKSLDYSSDQKQEYLVNELASPLTTTTTIYAADVPQNSGFLPKPTESEEPFPFHIPENAVPRRSTLFYGVEYENDPRLVTENPIENYTMPNTSGQHYQYSHIKGEQDDNVMPAHRKHVTINTSTVGNEYINSQQSEDFENTGMKTEAIRRTVVRFRPQSSGNFTPRESVKYMSVRADQVPNPEMSKHVHKIPMKSNKQTNILTTIDGRTLHPVDKDKVGRASLSMETEFHPKRRSFVENKVRGGSMMSEGYSEPVRMSVVDAQRGENNFVDLARPPEMQMVYAAPVIQTRRSVGRPSIHQSILQKEYIGERRFSSSLGKNMEMKESYPFNQEDKNPIVYRVSPTRRFSHKNREDNSIPTQRRQSKLYSKYVNDSSSGTDNSIEVYSYRKKSRPSVLKRPRHIQQHTVYAAQIPIVTFANPTIEKKKNSLFKKKEKYVEIKPEPFVTNDYCGLSCEVTQEKPFVKPQEKSKYLMDSSTQATDDEEEMDLICYPSEKFLKQSALASESGSKLRWRIIIKRGEEK